MKLLLILPFFLLLNACVSYDDFDTSQPAGAYGLAKKLQDDERFEEALIQYKDLKNRFPYSRYATEAELQIAEIQYSKEAYPEAQGAYQLFKELHPKHAKIDYVTFRIGESIYNQLPTTIDRDLSLAPNAINEYRVLLRDFPQSPYAKDAKAKIAECFQKLAEKELYIADFYFRTDKWQHALVRYEKFLKEFPKHDKRAHAMLQAGLAADKFGDPSKKNTLLRQLIKDYPNSKEAKKANGVL